MILEHDWHLQHYACAVDYREQQLSLGADSQRNIREVDDLRIGFKDGYRYVELLRIEDGWLNKPRDNSLWRGISHIHPVQYRKIVNVVDGFDIIRKEGWDLYVLLGEEFDPWFCLHN